MKKIEILCSWTNNTKDYFKKQLKDEKYWDDSTLTNEKYGEIILINMLIYKPLFITII